MNDFSAKKLGEALAFARVGQSFFSRTKSELAPFFNLTAITEKLNQQEKNIESYTIGSDHSEVIENKALATEKKIISMQDLYLKTDDDWQNPAELMEWLGFFIGAGFVHWQLAESIVSSDPNYTGSNESTFYLELLKETGLGIRNFHLNQDQ